MAEKYEFPPFLVDEEETEAAKKVLLLMAGPFFWEPLFSNVPTAIKLEGGMGVRP